ncbi:MAG: DUF421 domain-containing protein [Myxococcota bacterium]
METVLRVAFVYLFLMLGFRVLGKRELARLSPFELVTLMIIPEIVSQALTRGDGSLTNALIGVATLFCLVFLTSIATFRWPKARELVEGSPTVVVKHGKVLPDALARERITEDEVFSEMHHAGLERVEQVEWGYVETTGDLTFVPARPEDKQIKPREELP